MTNISQQNPVTSVGSEIEKAKESLGAEEIKKHLSNREWRLNNLYFIKNKHGNKVLFKMNEVQKEIHDNLWYFTIIPKARQLGVTTFFCILYLDQILFGKNQTAGIIAHRQEDMKKIFKDKIRFAWNHMHPWIRNKIGEPDTQTAYEMTFPNGSSIFVSMSTRSGTCQFLHISEFGYICQRFPEKAEEIVTGAINSVDVGHMVSIESTAAGKEGYFYEYCMTADKMRREQRDLTEMDFKIFFFPWWVDKKYTLEGKFPIEQEMREYFKNLEDRHGIFLTSGQKRWYVKKKQQNKDKVFAEYPSTLDEAFQASIEGAWYKKEMARVFSENRIKPVPHDDRLDVFTTWDLGMNDSNVILFLQVLSGEIRFIDMYVNSGERIAHYYNILKEKSENLGYRYTRHYLPHDVEVRDMASGVSRKQTMYSLGMTNIIVAEKMDISDGIDRVRTLFSRFYIDETRCAKLHEALFNYRKEFDKKLGEYKGTPRHDGNSHIADAVRTFATEYREDIFADPGSQEAMADQDGGFFG